MSGTDEVDDIRLPGRVPRSETRPRSAGPDAETTSGEDHEEIETVNRLLGFLRNDED